MNVFAMNSKPQILSRIAQIPAYIPGRPAPIGAYKMSANENPYPPLASVQEALAQAVGAINRYPDMANQELRQVIADFNNGSLADRLDAVAFQASETGKSQAFTSDNVVVGPGSVGVLAQILTAFCETGDEVIFAWRSFEAYPILTGLTGATAKPIPLRLDYGHDLEAMLNAINANTKVVLLCSPNNPTGVAISSAELEDFLARVPKDVAVVLDEAYLEFSKQPAAFLPESNSYLWQYPNLIILRTFSKAYGLAGLRIGYALAQPELVAAFQKTAIPFSVNALALAGVKASFAAQSELAARVTKIIAERERVFAALKHDGWELPVSAANFIYFPAAACSPAAFNAACEAAGIMARQYGADGVRVTISEPAANDLLRQVTRAFSPMD